MNPGTDPQTAIEQIQYLRGRFEADHHGLGYAAGHLLCWRQAQQEYLKGSVWLDTVERYWQSQLDQERNNIPLPIIWTSPSGPNFGTGRTRNYRQFQRM